MPSLLSIRGNSIHHYKGADLSDPLVLQECGDVRFYDMRYVGPVFAIHALICLGPQSAERREQQMGKERLQRALNAAYIGDFYNQGSDENLTRFDDAGTDLSFILEDGFNNGLSTAFDCQVIAPCSMWLRVRAAVRAIRYAWLVCLSNPSYAVCRRYLQRLGDAMLHSMASLSQAPK